ncbi:hypothetical protein F4777DRAFT_423772 [Nemania sp. FL0916]|nr:hypothetical protein F4777DRAFT_423772 [Nemania sp. FL0916]
MLPAGKRDTSDLEVHFPPEGLEVGRPDIQRTQPGLIHVDGPRVVSPDERFRNPVTSWDSESFRKQSGGAALNDAELSHAAPKTRRTMICGLRKRTFWIVVAVAIVALAGVVVGVAVSLTQQHKKLSTTPESASSGGGQVSSSPSPTTPPVIATETVYTEVGASSSAGSSETATPSSSSRISPAATEKGEGDSSPSSHANIPAAAVISTSTVFVTERPSATDTHPSQPPPTTTTTSQAPPPPPKPTTTTTTAPPPPPPPSTTTTTSTQPSSTYSPSSRICIGADGSTYTDPDTGAKFRLECGVAHQGKDIANPEAATMQACVSLCADDANCVGAIWYNVGPQGTDLNYCWLKSAMEDDLRVTEDAQSVVRL